MPYPVKVTECKKVRRASARLRDGMVQVKLPMRWSRAVKQEITTELIQRLTQQLNREEALLSQPAVTRQARVSFESLEALTCYIEQLNQETFQYPQLGKIRIGYSKYNHLAQVNLRTKTLTVSKYCIKNVPAEAFRYLIVHELAHYSESGHNKRFWALVGQFVPDYKLQSRIIKAFHHQAVLQDQPTGFPAKKEEPVSSPQQAETGQTQELPGFLKQLKFW